LYRKTKRKREKQKEKKRKENKEKKQKEFGFEHCVRTEVESVGVWDYFHT